MNAGQKLSVPEQKAFQQLQRFILKHNYPPTVGELAEQLKRTNASVHKSLDGLIRKGFIRRADRKARSIEIIRTPQTSVIDVVPVPLLGDVPAGVPISLEESSNGHVYVQSSVLGSDPCFALTVVGESMCKADIRNGDIVIVRQQPLAEPGEIVVASVDGEITVKRLAINDGRVSLLPENDEFEPIHITNDSELRILGRVIATRRLVNAR